MELFTGRPENTEGRLPREIRTYDFLDRLGIRYQRTDHERADNMEACNVIDAVLGVTICKNLFLCNRQKTVFYLLMMPGDKKFKTKELSAVSIMGLMNDPGRAVQLLVDEDVLRGEFIGCHPCVCTASLKLRTEDILQKFLPATGHTLRTVRLTGED